MTQKSTATVTVVDLGKQRNKHIKNLKNGTGKLMAMVPTDAPGPVVVVVRKKDEQALRQGKKALKQFRKSGRKLGIPKFITG